MTFRHTRGTMIQIILLIVVYIHDWTSVMCLNILFLLGLGWQRDSPSRFNWNQSDHLDWRGHCPKRWPHLSIYYDTNYCVGRIIPLCLQMHLWGSERDRRQPEGHIVPIEKGEEAPFLLVVVSFPDKLRVEMLTHPSWKMDFSVPGDG